MGHQGDKEETEGLTRYKDLYSNLESREFYESDCIDGMYLFLIFYISHHDFSFRLFLCSSFFIEKLYD
ncbi:hypothetical protein NC651_024771 [Populus alba x Populus x berolinensis]|nr:hypothetical protein NC651_024771 [Populus alba x Populus x berolinensis]